MPKIPGYANQGAERRRQAPVERHSLAVHAVAKDGKAQLQIRCRCGEAVRGNREQDAGHDRTIGTLALLELTRMHINEIDARYR